MIEYYGSPVAKSQYYRFAYDAWGATTGIYVADPNDDTGASDIQLAGYTYDAAGRLTRMDYPNGDYVTYQYDLLDRIIAETYNNTSGPVIEYRYVYDSEGRLARQYAVQNNTTVESYSFEYDSLGRLIRSREENGSGNTVQRTEHLYDTANRLTSQSWVVGDRFFTESYTYNSNDGSLHILTTGTNDTLTFGYDALKRLTGVTVQNSGNTTLFTRNYSYKAYPNDSTRTTAQLASYTCREPVTSRIIYGNSFDYDANGNITVLYEAYTDANGVDRKRPIGEYEYDKLNQLTKETRKTYTGTSSTPATTTVVTYSVDMAGNLQTVSGGEHTVNYTYSTGIWKDLLVGVTVDGTNRTISYASAGNPSNWYNGTEYTNLTWTQGRKLSQITKGTSTYSFEYDMSGIRSVKIADGLRHEYVTQNGRVVRELVTNASTGAYVRCLDFFYDENGNPFALRVYRDSTITSYDTYHYVCNAQGDVVQINYQGGTVYAEYTYDAWGAVLTAAGTLADVNPLRYRGYYYDTETGFYYLQSRYYDPIVKRFINADGYASTGTGFLGYNMFAYCENGPICNCDPSGNSLVPSSILCADKAPCRLYSSKSTDLKKKALRIKRSIATPESWKNLSTSEKREAVVLYYSELQDLLGIDNYTLTFKKPPGESSDSFGSCSDSEGYIWINVRSDYLNSYEILATVAHECYHAYQKNVLGGRTAEDRYVINRWKADDKDILFGELRSDYEYFWGTMEQGARWFERDPYETVVSLYPEV